MEGQGASAFARRSAFETVVAEQLPCQPCIVGKAGKRTIQAFGFSRMR